MTKPFNLLLVLTFCISAVLGDLKECAEQAAVAVNNGQLQGQDVEKFEMETDPNEVSFHVKLDGSKLSECGNQAVVEGRSEWKKGEQPGNVVVVEDNQRGAAMAVLKNNGEYKYEESSDSRITRPDFIITVKPYAVKHFWPEHEARQVKYGEFLYDDSGLF